MGWGSATHSSATTGLSEQLMLDRFSGAPPPEISAPLCLPPESVQQPQSSREQAHEPQPSCTALLKMPQVGSRPPTGQIFIVPSCQDDHCSNSQGGLASRRDNQESRLDLDDSGDDAPDYPNFQEHPHPCCTGGSRPATWTPDDSADIGRGGTPAVARRHEDLLWEGWSHRPEWTLPDKGHLSK